MRLHKRIAAALCSVVIAFALSVPAFAAEPVEHPHVSRHTSISSATTHANNGNNSGANTHFFLFIENPLEVSALPQTGDAGLDLMPLTGAALAAGAGFLICGAYAERKR